MTASQSTDAGTNPPQFNALTATTNVVSVQIGGNDIGFSEILQNCATANPFGRPCQNRYAPGGVDQLRARIVATAPKIDAVLGGHQARVAERADPRRQLRRDRAAHRDRAAGRRCRWRGPTCRTCAAMHEALNAMLARARGGQRTTEHAHRGHVRPERGRDACRSSSTRWVEPLVPGNTAAPFHPNARGMAAFAPLVAAASN